MRTQPFGFTLRSVREIPELCGRLHELEHEASGAKLVWLEREEENKTFGIAFRTLPEDDTGVFHILEHSVLCGSARYPVKEPFVELMKSSMQTFLNAMTFPDKTVYPVSSRNDKDFLNLLRVYMDAVLHPQIYAKPEIFEQEGWHYELDAAGHPSYKGVVFNEMKGAFASPDTLARNEVHRLLFPDTPYRHVFGGDPAHIPELTYERFLDCHRRFYHPSNAYIFLDGRIDLEQVLSILDGEYLSAYSREEGLPELLPQAPVKGEGVRAYYEISPGEPVEGRTRMTWGYVLGDFRCREEQMAMHALADVLCGGNQAPLKKGILSTELAQDVRIGVMDGILQPYVTLEVLNMDESRAMQVETVLRGELERLAREGLDHQRLAATLANLEFQTRERDFGRTPQGLGFGLGVLDSWLYGGDPAANLEVGELFASLNRKLEEGWFERLLERVFLRNPHSCQVTLLPSATLGEENRAAEKARLHAARERWSAEDVAALQKRQEDLAAWQASADTPEALAALPALQLSDIPVQPKPIPAEVCALAGRPLLRHNIPTGGISYVNLYFDISDFSREKLPHISFLSALLGGLDTADHSSLELQKLCRLNLGSMGFSVEAYGGVNAPETCRTFLCVSFSALDTKLEAAADLAAEIVTGTRFDNQRMIRELLRQSITGLEQDIVGSGSGYAITRITAGHSAAGVVAECTRGVTYCQWLKALEKDFARRASRLAGELEELRCQLFVKNRLTVSVTGTNGRAGDALASAFISRLPVSGETAFPCAVRPWGVRREGIVVPADVSFAALGGSLNRSGGAYSGGLRVLSRVVSLAYLWNVVRVQGGAYGTGLAPSDSGTIVFYSYCDPDAARSLAAYRQAADFAARFCGDQSDLTGFIVGAVAEADPLMLPQRQGKAADSFYFKGVSYADRCNIRREMLSAAPGALAGLVQSLREVGSEGSICVIGPRRQIEACGEEIDTIYTL